MCTYRVKKILNYKMKSIINLTAIVVLITLATSCEQSTSLKTLTSCEQQSDMLKFKTIEINEFLKHPHATEDYQGLRYEISFTYPSEFENKDVLAILQSKFIEHVLGKKYVSLSPEDAVKACIEDWKKEYKSDIEDEPFAYEYIYFDTISFVNDVLLQMKSYGYSYKGGAHGSGGFNAILFNIQTGKEYSRNNIFKLESENNIRTTITSELLKYWEVEDDTEFFFEEDAVWREETAFAISSEGITFLYSDYELGSYALGCPEITIPFTDIFPFLYEGTPVWELAKEKIINSLNDKTRALLAKKELNIGSTLEDLLKCYPKYKIEIYYDEMGFYKYTTLDKMLKNYGKEWHSAYKDWAIFTPLKPNGEEMSISFFILFKNLDNLDSCKKQSTIWMVNVSD